jgi:hypothetical protein
MKVKSLLWNRRTFLNTFSFYFLIYYLTLFLTLLMVIKSDIWLNSFEILFKFYSFLFAIYVLILFTLLIKVILAGRKPSYFSLFVSFLSVLFFLLKLKTAFFIDARPPATFRALYGADSKHSYSIILFWKVLSWIKYPAFQDIVVYNIFLGSIILILCYFYFWLITKDRLFGFISFFF